MTNQSTDKSAVFAEVFRVLRAGGRIGVADIVVEDRLTPQQRRERGSWAGCIAGALQVREDETGLADAGFTDVEIVLTSAVTDAVRDAIVRTRKAVPAA